MPVMHPDRRLKHAEDKPSNRLAVDQRRLYEKITKIIFFYQ